jgi:hypothetical protein
LYNFYETNRGFESTNMLRHRQLLASSLICIYGTLFFIGCDSRAGAGPERYEISGTATFKGAPIPFGEIVFAPDESQGNSGPGTSASIQDGKFRTMAGQGIVGGPHTVYIRGFDGPLPAGAPPAGSTAATGAPLFSEYVTQADLPRKNANVDFDVPE